jgi:DNA repair protein RadC
MNVRVYESQEPIFKTPVDNPKKVYDSIKHYSTIDREIVIILSLNSACQVLDCAVVSVGGITHSDICPSTIFKPAVLAGASSIIIAHNHPAGRLDPSPCDCSITKTLLKAAQLLGLKLLDHMIITRTGFYSFADAGKMDEYEAEVNWQEYGIPGFKL